MLNKGFETNTTYHMKNKLSVQGKYLGLLHYHCVTITLMKLDHARPIDAARRRTEDEPCGAALGFVSHDPLQLCNNTDYGEEKTFPCTVMNNK